MVGSHEPYFKKLLAYHATVFARKHNDAKKRAGNIKYAYDKTL